MSREATGHTPQKDPRGKKKRPWTKNLGTKLRVPKNKSYITYYSSRKTKLQRTFSKIVQLFQGK